MNYKEIFKVLPENEKLALIDAVIPCSGTHRHLEQNMFSDVQIEQMAELFCYSILWEKLELLNDISTHDKYYYVLGVSDLSNEYEATALYSCGNLITIEDLELKTKP